MKRLAQERHPAPRTGSPAAATRRTAAQVQEPEPFRFTDIPLGQWVVGGLMTLVMVGVILLRHL